LENILIFTDASLNPKTKTGFGAYLVITKTELNNLSLDLINKNITIVQFEGLSIFALEIKTLLTALAFIKDNFKNITVSVYTDSQGISGLNRRRSRLENINFKSLNINDELKNAALYKEYFFYQDILSIETIKVKGHSNASGKNSIEKIFSLVDRASRKALRNYL